MRHRGDTDRRPGRSALALRTVLPLLPRRLRGHLVKLLDPLVRPARCVDDALGVPFEYAPGRIESGMFFGLYEADDAAMVRRLLRTGMTVLDVGANIGWYSALFASCVLPGGRIVCVEPYPASLTRLGRLQALVDCGPAMRVIPGVVSDVVGPTVLYLNRYHPGHTLLKELTEGHPAFTGETIATDSTTLDALASDCELDRVDLLKIDVEGAELSVLEGGRSALAAGRVQRILVEVNDFTDRAGGSNAAAVHAYLSALGFSGYRAQAGKLYPVSYAGLARRQTNVFYLSDSEETALLAPPGSA